MPTLISDHADIGKRIRVRLNSRRVCEDAPHKSVEHGATGTIVRCDSPFSAHLHPFLVKYDEAIAWPIGDGSWPPIRLAVQRYTADELERLI